MRLETRRCANPGELAREAARAVRRCARRAVAARGRFVLALSGGRTFLPLYSLLSEPRWLEQLPWGRTHLIWCDERCVPPGHPDSNFGAARRALLSRVPLPPGRAHRMRGEKSPPERAARDYERELRRLFPGESWPRADLALLGVGEDGHTASLFPGDPALEERERWVLAARAPAGFAPRLRLTLSLPALNASRRVLLAAWGPGKRRAVHRLSTRPDAPGAPPAARLRPRGRLLRLFA